VALVVSAAPLAALVLPAGSLVALVVSAAPLAALGMTCPPVLETVRSGPLLLGASLSLPRRLRRAVVERGQRVESWYPGGHDPAGRFSWSEADVLLDYILTSERFAAAAPKLRRAAAVYAPSFFAPYVLAAAIVAESGENGRRAAEGRVPAVGQPGGAGWLVVAPDGEAAAKLAAELGVYLQR